MTMIAQKFLSTSSPTLSHFPNFSLATKLQRPLFQLSHWSPEHMAHYNLLLLIIIPGIHNLTCFCDVKITRYTDRTLLDFVEFVSSTLPHYICFTTVFPCTYVKHFVSNLNQLRDYLY